MLIKPHHFMDIIKLYGGGRDKLVEHVWKEEDEEGVLERKRLFAAGARKYLG